MKVFPLVNYRQKIIKLADKSDLVGPLFMNTCDDLADDDAEATKIKKAEKRVAAKFKSLDSAKSL